MLHYELKKFLIVECNGTLFVSETSFCKQLTVHMWAMSKQK